MPAHLLIDRVIVIASRLVLQDTFLESGLSADLKT
jgi:hypothetical protein